MNAEHPYLRLYGMLLSQLLFSDQEAPADQVIHEILAADDTRVKFVNDLLTDADDEEEF